MASFVHIFIVSYSFRADLYIFYIIFCISSSHNDIATCDVAVLNSWVLDSVLGSTFIHSFIILSDERSKASSKTIPPHSAI